MAVGPPLEVGGHGDVCTHGVSQLWPIHRRDAGQPEQVSERVWAALPLPSTINDYQLGPDLLGERPQRRVQDVKLRLRPSRGADGGERGWWRIT